MTTEREVDGWRHKHGLMLRFTKATCVVAVLFTAIFLVVCMGCNSAGPDRKTDKATVIHTGNVYIRTKGDVVEEATLLVLDNQELVISWPLLKGAKRGDRFGVEYVQTGSRMYEIQVFPISEKARAGRHQ